MTDFWERLRSGMEQIGTVLPALIAAAVILLAGYLLARQIQRWIQHILQRMNFNRVADRGGLTEAVGRAGADLDASRTIGNLLFWLVMLGVILLSSMALGLESVNDMFSVILSYMPTLLAAVLIVILGMIIGEFVRMLIVASAGAVDGVPTLAKVAKVAVITISIFMALQQLGVASDIVTSAFTLILGAVALAIGLAFGLGNRELAGEITRRWYEEGRARARRARAGAPATHEAGDAEPPGPPPAP